MENTKELTQFQIDQIQMQVRLYREALNEKSECLELQKVKLAYLLRINELKREKRIKLSNVDKKIDKVRTYFFLFRSLRSNRLNRLDLLRREISNDYNERIDRLHVERQRAIIDTIEFCKKERIENNYKCEQFRNELIKTKINYLR